MEVEKFITEEGLQQAQATLNGLAIYEPYQRKRLSLRPEMSWREIGEILDLPEMTVKNIETVAIRKLRKMLAA